MTYTEGTVDDELGVSLYSSSARFPDADQPLIAPVLNADMACNQIAKRLICIVDQTEAPAPKQQFASIVLYNPVNHNHGLWHTTWSDEDMADPDARAQRDANLNTFLDGFKGEFNAMFMQRTRHALLDVLIEAQGRYVDRLTEIGRPTSAVEALESLDFDDLPLLFSVIRDNYIDALTDARGFTPWWAPFIEGDLEHAFTNLTTITDVRGIIASAERDDPAKVMHWMYNLGIAEITIPVLTDILK